MKTIYTQIQKVQQIPGEIKMNNNYIIMKSVETSKKDKFKASRKHTGHTHTQMMKDKNSIDFS